MDNMAEYQNYEQYRQAVKDVLNRTVEDFVITGYLLKQGRDTNVLQESGYKNVNEFAWAEFKLDPTQVSRYININDRFSEEGCSPRLKEEYRGYGYAKLAIMLTLPESVTQELSPAYSKSEIQEIKEEIEAEEKVTDIEVILEGEKEEQKELGSLEKALNEIFRENPELYKSAHKTLHAYPENLKCLKEVFAPQGEATYTPRVQGFGRIMVYMSISKSEIITHAVRQGEKESHSWGNVLRYCEYITKESDPEENWEKLFGQQYPQIAPVQEKKRKKSKVVKAKTVTPKKNLETQNKPELPDDIPGQMEIAKDFPELLPEVEVKEEIAPVQLEKEVNNSVENSEEIEENAINTEADTDSQSVDNFMNPPEQTREEYIKGLPTYKLALYIAASMKEIPHMTLDSPEFWNRWLRAKVNEKGDET